MNESKKERIIPYNYKDNGRVLNLFKKKVANKLIIYGTAVFGIMYIIPIEFKNKVFWLTLLIALALFIFPEEYDVLLLDMYKYSKKKKIFYLKGEKNVKSYYEKAKEAKIGSK